MKVWCIALSWLLCWAAVPAAVPAAEPSYPAGPVKLVVPFPPGGPVDSVGRLIAHKLGELLTQPVYVDNKGGAGGAIGAQAVASSAPNGYTLLLGSTATISILPLVNAAVRYNPDEDFTPLAISATGVQIFVVNSKVPVNTIQELIAYVRKSKEPVTAATGGSANPFFIALFEREAGIKFLHVPYKGTGPSLADVAAGHIVFTVADTSAVLPLLQTGQIKALGISSLRRNPLGPEIPTIAEQGFPGFEVGGWFGVFAPKGLPQPVHAKLVSALEMLSRDADTNAQLQKLGLSPSWSVGDAAVRNVQKENSRYRALAKAMDVKPQ
ncbi:tripartite tricarboxylate transporter substrate binding protein [uncultured Pigmentiphaga sp.]|uniref:Bug family tripartite tricarboxylate transporter substrate binding protein n=1 Tax=uncultured Pigmentiphaga sp. TaxID=340361 RepID=UPI002607239C|nr:tripartite tricarboxylate transporter substrate binding protein [uncultured Pigmentiphaga sp.]